MTRTVVLTAIVTVAVCAPAQAAQTTRSARRARATSRLKATAGRAAPNGVALVTGKPPHGVRKPKSFALSKDQRFGKGDVVLGASIKKPKGGRFSAWVSFPEGTPTGRRNLLACRAAKPSARGCAAAGTLKVAKAPAPRVVTPALDQAHATSTNLDFRGGTATATAADGTVFTVTVPPNSTIALAVALTPVTSLAPENVVGRLESGVMIGPIGDAPPGSTLTIKRPAATPKGAAVVGFGGVDPSGAAFRLPIKPGQTTTIPLTTFGGYGIAVAGRSAHAALAHAACAPAAHLAAAGSRPKWSCVSAAQIIQQLSDAVVASNYDPATMNAASDAATQAIDAEIANITSQPPSEAGLAEMEAVMQLAIGIARQDELRGRPEQGSALDSLGKGLKYSYDVYAKLCTETQPRSDVRFAYGLRIIGLAREQQLLSFSLPGDLGDLFDRCVSKIHLQLDATIDATIHTGAGFGGSSQIVSHAKEHVSNADIVVKNNGQGFLGHTLALQTEQLPLSFDADDATLQPPFPPITASPGTPSGTFQVALMTLQAVTRVRCDKNRKFVVEHTVTLNVYPPAMWDDHTPVTLAANGTTVEQLPQAVAAESWENTYPTGDNLAHPIVVPLDETPVPVSANGPCTVSGAAECATFTYGAQFVGRALPG